jgi:flavin-dependent dehydrogenase
MEVRMVDGGTALRGSSGPQDPAMTLQDGSRVAVIGSGPAGSLFSYYALEMAARIGLDIEIDIYEPRLFPKPGPVGCNMCGGIISETLVQNLAMDGVRLPSDVVQRGIDSYVMHMDVGSVRIATPSEEMRIGAVHRGGGPRDVTETKWESFDHHLQKLALDRGAKVIQTRVEEVTREDGRPTLHAKDGAAQSYDLVVIAVGVNSSILKTFEGLGIGYERPKLTKTLIREYYLGDEVISEHLGSSMHVFLLDIPRLEFAALIPKGDYVTMCLLGEDIDNSLGDAFASAPEVRAVMPAGWEPDEKSCQCIPHINIHGVEKPYADRIVFIGDAGVTRLYKDGIGAAYRTAKAAAKVAVFEGVSEQAFKDHYMPVCRSIMNDNRIGGVAFILTRVAQRVKPLRRLILRETIREQSSPGSRTLLSSILWDMFSGSAPYGDIFRRMFHPALIARMALAAPQALIPSRRRPKADRRPG